MNVMKNYMASAVVILLLTVSAMTTQLSAQVNGLSYTVSPLVERNWFGESSGLANGYLGGAQLGFGFGQNVELRANYLRGFELRNDINRFGIEDLSVPDSLFSPSDVSMTRYGGELKLNLSRGFLLPYLTVGTGIQTMELDGGESNRQIYVTTGGGIQFSAGSRYTIGVQALRHSYRANPVNQLLSVSDRELYDINGNDFGTENISNWALRASLIFYLGGRAPGELTDIDRAYYDNFSGGLRGLSVPVEPTVTRVDFHEDLPYRSTWMAGGAAGFDFGPLVGIRGFYWRGIEEGSTTSFDNFAMYGGEGRFRLNEGKGFTPFITIGGGQIDPGDDYIGRDSTAVTDSKVFAMGGLGLDLPFSKYFKATGYVRSLLTSVEDEADVNTPDDVKASWAYGVSLNFILGKKTKKVSKAKQAAFDDIVAGANAENALIQAEYEQKIIALENQLQNALENNDIESAQAIQEEKQVAEQVLSTIQVPVAVPSAASQMGNSGSMVQMTPAELQLLLRDARGGQANASSPAPAAMAASQPDIAASLKSFEMEQNVKQLEKTVTKLETEVAELIEETEELEDETEELSEDFEETLQILKSEYQSQNQRLSRLQNEMSRLKMRQSDLERQPSTDQSNIDALREEQRRTRSDIEGVQDGMISLLDEMIGRINNKLDADDRADRADRRSRDDRRAKRPMKPRNKGRIDADFDQERQGPLSKLVYRGASGFAGFNVGGNASFNIGYRMHYGIKGKKNLEFMPETFIGFGSPSNFGLFANAIHFIPLGKKQKNLPIEPYVGLGLGLMKTGNAEDADQLRGAYNFILGTNLVRVWNGNVYVDFTARNLFRYNQLIVGYRLPF